ncbi:NAD(P)-binding Rossmann-fold superfamily protein [Trifolium repens]|nr:NAD(P)-binding Rossmann-fold superfamily protein [Trifolium repens]
MKKIVVTGASGYLGGRLCHALIRQGYFVKALAWHPDPSKFFSVNVEGLKHVLEAVKKTNTVEKFIYTSSIVALGPTDGSIADESQVHHDKYFCTEYEKSKFASDKIALQAAYEGVPIVLLCPGFIYGPGKTTEANIVAKTLVERFSGRLPGYIGNENNKISFCHVDDVAEGHIAAMIKGQIGERYLLTGENVSFNQIFDMVAMITNTRKPLFTIPLWVLQVYGWVSVFFSPITGKLPFISPPAVDILRHEWEYSCEKAKAELDYNPRSMAEGLEEVLLWLKDLGLVKY